MKHLATIAFLLTNTLLFSFSIAQDEESKKTNPTPTSKQQTKQPAKPQQIASYADLVKAYERQNISVKSNEKSQTLMFQTKRPEFVGVMVVKWDQVNGVCHFIQTTPFKIEKDDYPLYLEAAAKLNHGFLFPGIGLDMERGGNYYRLSVPIEPRKYLFDYEIASYTNFTLNKASEFLPTLKKVIDGTTKVENVVKVHQLHMIELRTERNAMAKLAGKYESDALDEAWTIIFFKNGNIHLLRDGEKEVQSSYKVKGNQITVQDLDGKLASEKPGIYKFQIKDEQLIFTLVKDDAEDRVEVVTSKPWKRIAE